MIEKELNADFDKEINQKFYEIFDNNSSNETDSSIVTKIYEIKSENFMTRFDEINISSEESETLLEKSLKYTGVNNLKNLLQEKNEGNDFKFSFVNPKGVKTTIFQIFINYDYNTLSSYRSVIPLPYFLEELDGGMNKQTFYINIPSDFKNGNEVCVLQFSEEDQGVYVNMGIINGNSLRISKKPQFLAFDNFYSSGNTNIDCSLYEDSNLLDDASIVNKTTWRTSMSAETIIVDPQTAELVKREIQYNSATNELEAFIELEKNRSYFAFKIMTQGKFKREMDSIQIGKCYMHGSNGFPNNLIKALEYFEKADTPEAYFYISCIFFGTSNMHNYEMGMYYLQKSCEAEYHKALSFSWIKDAFSDNRNSCTFDIKLVEQCQNKEYFLERFLYAYALEWGVGLKEDVSLAFEQYWQLAIDGYIPAQYRLNCNWNSSMIKEELKRTFEMNHITDEYKSKYVLGCILMYESDIYLFESVAHKLFLEATNGNYEDAKCALAESYDNGYGTPEDKEKALNLYLELAYDHLELANKTANKLLDGVGCEICQQNDIRAFDLLFAAYNSEHISETTVNNLAWLYKNGRGVDVDYEKARSLFEEAVIMGSGSSCFHLGDMYEKGLGVSVDLSMAETFYEEGAKQENKRSIKALERIRTSNNTQKNNENTVSTIMKKFEHIECELAKNKETTNQIKNATDVIIDQTKKISKQLVSLELFLTNDLLDRLNKSKQELREAIESEFQKEEHFISEFIQKQATYINSQTQSMNELLEKEEIHLKSLFGYKWDKLDGITRASLRSAGVLWKGCDGITDPTFDYSGICISATSALELELKRCFYTGFQAFVKSKYGNPDFETWPESILSHSKDDFAYAEKRYVKDPSANKKPILEEGDSFTIGSLPFLLGKYALSNIKNEQHKEEQENLLNARMEEYLSYIVKQTKYKSIRDIFNAGKNNFVSKCERIRKDYRNPAAHSNIILREKAEECYLKVVGRFDALDYKEEVTSVLSLLYELVDIDKVSEILC